jgi:hypothetical protein
MQTNPASLFSLVMIHLPPFATGMPQVVFCKPLNVDKEEEEKDGDVAPSKGCLPVVAVVVMVVVVVVVLLCSGWN